MKITNLSKTFIALRHPNFRLWFIGQVVSLVGTWMQSTAQGYLVYELTQSSAYLGVVSFANGLPTLLFTLFGGVIADRIPRRKLIIITQSSMMALALILAVLTFTGVVQPWHIVILAFLLGTANAFDAPARQSFIVELVDRNDLANGIALNSTIFNLGTVIGPSIGGLVYAWVGPGWCFTLNGISFIAVIIALALMRLVQVPRIIEKASPLSNIKEGIRFIASETRVKVILLYLGVVSTFGFSMMTLIPAWAVKILGGDVRTNGLMLSARGLGALIGALMIAYIGARQLRKKVWLAGWYVMPLALFIFAWVRWVPVSLLLLVLMGWGLMSVVNISNALIQSYVPDHLRGRVMGVYILVFQGGMPIGSLIVGAVAAQLGEPTAVMINASLLFITALGTFFLRKTIQTF